MRVLVTGGLGFLGSTIVETLAARGDSVVVCDDLSNNVVGFKDLPIWSWHRCDVEDCLGGLEDQPDLVVHCASPVGAAGILPRKGRLAWEIMRTTQAVAEYCAAVGARLVNISTSEVYGRSGVYHETDDLRVPPYVNARLEYAVGKLASEHTVRLLPGLRSITLRPFNLVGHRQRSEGGFVLPTFCEQALRGEPLTIYGDGFQERSFTAVEDVARFITLLEPEHYDGRVVNVGNPGNRTTILNLAYRVRIAIGSSSRVVQTSGQAVHGPDYAEAEGHIKVPDITRARQMGWQPRLDLPAIIETALGHLATSR